MAPTRLPAVMMALMCLVVSCPEVVVSASAATTSVPPFDEFPALDDVSEMANLSHSVYQYKKYPDVDQVCEDWNHNQTTVTHRDDVICHWYRHDKTLGTQVMIVTSSEKNYLAVVFAGTDDLMTSLLDVDVRQVDFGTCKDDHQTHNHHNHNKNASRIPVSLDCKKCKVHEGFNNAVFANHIFDDIYIRVEALRTQYTRLFVTGHSLGAADSMLTAIALALEFEKKTIALPHPVTSLNFGCPQVGNIYFQRYIHQHFLSHSNATRSSPYLSIWRFVMGWDLVPRLPVGYQHIGHTVQMHHPECKDIITNCYHHHQQEEDEQLLENNNKNEKWVWPDYDNITKEALTYYHHYGNVTLHYAGVPPGWSAKPYLWVPGAISSHAIKRYAQYFYEWETKSSDTWIRDFVHDQPPTNHSSDALIDDDTYAEPPDDDAAALLLDSDRQVGGDSLWERVQKRLLRRRNH